MEIEIRGEKLLLHRLKFMYWPRENAIVLSDLHIGKVSHFRRNGFSVPNQLIDDGIRNLITALKCYQPAKAIIVGDMFHATVNKEWLAFKEVRDMFSDTAFILVKGNHDILGDHIYQEMALTVHDRLLQINPFTFTHFPVDGPLPKSYFISGHFHPAVALRGKGRQGVRVQCFYFGEHGAILPAFSNFTGTHKIKPKPEDTVVGVVEKKLMLLSGDILF